MPGDIELRTALRDLIAQWRVRVADDAAAAESMDDRGLYADAQTRGECADDVEALLGPDDASPLAPPRTIPDQTVYVWQLRYMGQVLDQFDGTENAAIGGWNNLVWRIMNNKVPDFLGSDDFESYADCAAQIELVKLPDDSPWR